MNKKSAYRIVSVIILLNLIFSFTAKSINNEPERERLFNSGWKFIRDSVPGAERPEFNDSKWMIVDLPHDYQYDGNNRRRRT